MKKIIILLIAIVTLPFSCSIIKRKNLNKTTTEVKIKNDIKTSAVRIDSFKMEMTANKVKVSDVEENDVSVKSGNRLENIVLAANFRLDTSALLKDTLKMVDINNNGVTLSIFQSGKEVMARVTTPKTSQTAPFDEIRIRNKKTKTAEKTDSLATFENHSEIKAESLDQSIKEEKKSTVIRDKEKTSKPNFWIWIGVVAVVCFFIWLWLRKK